MVELIDLEYECFPDFVRESMMGCFSPADIPRIRAKHVKEMLEMPSDIWVYIKDIESGRIIAGSNWRVYLNREAGLKGADAPPPWSVHLQYPVRNRRGLGFDTSCSQG